MQRSVEEERAWQEARRVVLERDGHRCAHYTEGANGSWERCSETRTSSGLDVHHLIPRAQGGRDEPANLITLCDRHHAARHPRLQVSLARSALERMALRLARLFDQQREVPEDMERVSVAMRLLGIDKLRDGQLEVILAALRGESLLAVRPTGSGKSLCFQLPALLSAATSYVICPLKTLMTDQVLGLTEGGVIPATFINSDLDWEEKERRYRILEQGGWKLLYVAPERFDPDSIRNQHEINRLLARGSTYFIVDEAHVIKRWGDDFRTAYGRLGEVRRQLGNPPVLAFTATAGARAQDHILASLGVPEAKRFLSEVNRPNIFLMRLRNYAEADRYALTARLIKELRPGSGERAMVFVPTLNKGEAVKSGLQTQGLDVPFYHARLPKNDRDFILGRFLGSLQPPLPAVVCTNAFGMGIDAPHVRLVVHWCQPESVEDYVQEFGRAGRDGEPALAIIFQGPRDRGLREFMAECTAEDAAKRGVDPHEVLREKLRDIDTLSRMVAAKGQCFRRAILEYYGTDESAPKRSLAMRILEWLLGRRRRARHFGFCCDACNAKLARSIVEGTGRTRGTW